MLELSILIPCLNEAGTVEKCIEKAKTFLEKESVQGEILVVDNASTDASGEIATKAGAKVVKEIRKGYGYALRAGIRQAKGNYIIMGDADDSYDFSELMPMLQKLRGGVDLVVGNRFQGGIEKGAMPFLHRYLGNPVLSFFGRLLYPCKVRDFHCGLRGFDREKFAKLPFQSTGMEFASEMILLAKKAGYQIEEVPVKLYPDGREGASHLKAFRDGLRHIGVLLKYRPILSLIMTFVATFLVCVGLLVAVDTIPQKAVEKQIGKSSEYFLEHELFGSLWENHNFTMYDNYADVILTNIIFSMDSTKPFESTIKASYYGEEMVEVNDNLHLTVQGHLPGNIDYFRYWHGSMVLLRPLFCVFSITGVRAALMALFAGLVLLTGVVLWRDKKRAPAVIYIVSLLLVQAWMCALSIEFITTFIVMAAFMLIIALQERNVAAVDQYVDQKYVRQFMMSGMIACFVDFLTTETITVTMPLLLIFMLRKEKKQLRDFKEEALFAIKCGVAWGVSYAMMFLLKWGISAMVLGWEAFGSAFGEATFRIAGEVTDNNTNLGNVLGVGTQLSGTLWKNLQALLCLPVDMPSRYIYGITIGGLFVLFAIWYLFHKKQSVGAFQGLLLILGLIPYVRFLALRNHSFIHYFFTYRAQVVTVAVILAVMWYSLRKGETIDRKERQ